MKKTLRLKYIYIYIKNWLYREIIYFDCIEKLLGFKNWMDGKTTCIKKLLVLKTTCIEKLIGLKN
jgi:hypothetical protein